MVKCIVIDDQKDAIELLTHHIGNRNDLQLLETFTNPLKALEFLETNKVDLIFVDVQMPNLNGIEFIETLRDKYGSKLPHFMLTTGFDEYALPGFEQGVADYLLKPIGNKRFKIALDRFFSRRQTSEPETTEKKSDYFFADNNGRKQKINFKEVAYFESAGNYVIIYGDNNLKAMVYTSMNGIQELVPQDTFMRVHKSYIVSIDYLHAIRGNELIMNRSGAEVIIPIGVTYRGATLKKLKVK
jgi:two-component system, LytTR family, response regulator